MRFLFIICCLGWLEMTTITPGYAAVLPWPAQIELTQTLSEWYKLGQQITGIKNEQLKLDTPDDANRYWWNPVWRLSRENQAQRSNSLILELQKLEQQQQNLEVTLLGLCNSYALTCVQATTPFTAEQQTLWAEADAWRMPRLLEPPDWHLFSAAALSALPQELITRRKTYLQQRLKTWQTLKPYLEKMQTQTLPTYSGWLNQLERILTECQKTMNTWAND